MAAEIARVRDVYQNLVARGKRQALEQMSTIFPGVEARPHVDSAKDVRVRELDAASFCSASFCSSCARSSQERTGSKRGERIDLLGV